MKQQNNCSPSKANAITNGLNASIEEKISNNEFQKTVVKIINDLKGEKQKIVFDFKKDMNKQLNELKENTNR
jgi:disulfide oxidoreductase YuzD